MSISTECDILSKYKNLFPDTFLKCIHEGCTWLANHNNITYQTTIMVRTDNDIYNNSGSTALRLGIIDTNNPLSGLQFYDVLAVVDTSDNITGNTVFKIKANYKTPLGIELTLLPIKYYNPNKKEEKEYYTKEEVDELIKDAINNIDLTLKVNENVTFDKQEIIDVLKNDVEFKQSVTGPQGPQGETGEQGVPGISVNKEEVINAIKEDAEFKNSLKPDISDLVTTEFLETALNNKLDNTALDNYVTSDELAKTYITKETAGNTYLQQTIYAIEKANMLALKRDVETTYLSKKEAEQKYQPKNS